MSYYHLFCALLAEQNRRHIRVVDFFGSVVGSYLRAERSFVCVQELVRVFFPLQKAFLLFSTLLQKDTGWRSIPRSIRSITHGRK